MKKLLTWINMGLAAITPNVFVSNKKNNAIATVIHEDNQEHHEMKNVLYEALEMAAASRRVEEELVYKSYGLERPSDETKTVITMNADGSFTQGTIANPNGQKFIPVSDKDREIYNKMKQADSFNFSGERGNKVVHLVMQGSDKEKE